MRHRKRGAHAVRRDEAELARDGSVAAARDEDRAEPLDRGLTGLPLREGEERMAGAARAVGVDRTAVRHGQLLFVGEVDWIAGAARAQRLEQRSIGLLRGVREAPLEAAEQDRGAALDDRER